MIVMIIPMLSAVQDSLTAVMSILKRVFVELFVFVYLTYFLEISVLLARID